MLLLLGSPLSWAIGSLYSRRADRPVSAFLGTGMQLLAGGGLVMVVSVATGEFGRLASEPVFASPRPILALVYLAVFGSLLGYTAYIWLLDRVSPALVSTYAYVNPVVAVVLGAWLGGEKLTGRILLAAAIIIAGVVVIVTSTQRRKRAATARAMSAAADSARAGVPVTAIPLTGASGNNR
jgi:drug/metabolite transporter (DMT)-like permease